MVEGVQNHRVKDRLKELELQGGGDVGVSPERCKLIEFRRGLGQSGSENDDFER